MVGSRYRNLAAGQAQAIRALWGAVGVALVCALMMGIGWMRSPSALRIHIPPDLSAGAVLAVDEPLAANVYTFALYIWQQLYRWPTDGAEDYASRVESLGAFLTPACQEDRRTDVGNRLRMRQLAGRKRSVWEIPGRGYSVERVYEEGGGSWVVSLDLQVEETYLGRPVKLRLATYPLRVRRYTGDPEMNPWGLAVDCLAGEPIPIMVDGEE